MNISFYLNRELVHADVDPHQTSLVYLRETRGLTGVKETCNEGDCGACVIALGEYADEKMQYLAINSCLFPAAHLHGKHIVTLEGISDKDMLHPIQQVMLAEHAVQCGFCTSGIILSLFCLFQHTATPSEEEVLLALDGSLCRCTGYASILRAAHKLSEANHSNSKLLKHLTPSYFSDIEKRLQEFESDTAEGFEPLSGNKDYHIPEDLHELFGILDSVDNPSKLTLIHGDTDVMVGVNLGKHKPQKIVDLYRIKELKRISKGKDLLSIGARTTLSDVLGDCNIQKQFPALIEAILQMCSTPIRNAATLVGNVCTASPIADAIPPLLAYKAIVVAQSIKGTRRVALRDWFTTYRKTVLGHDEIVIAIELPFGDSLVSFEKTGKRKTLDIATVNSALAIKVEKEYFKDVQLFYGGVAAVPFEAEMTIDFLQGREATEAAVREAASIVSKEISPLGDVRGSVDFRRQLAANHLLKHFTKLMPTLFG